MAEQRPLDGDEGARYTWRAWLASRAPLLLSMGLLLLSVAVVIIISLARP